MKVGVIAPLWYHIPPKGYGGTEEVVYNTVVGLTEKGHDVTMFGSADSDVPCKVVPIIDKPLMDKGIAWEDKAVTHQHILAITKALDMADQFDILHFPLNITHDYFALPLVCYSKVPAVFTLHFSLAFTKAAQRFERLDVLHKYKYLPFTSISNVQRDNENLNFVKTVYNSLRIQHFDFSDTAEDYFVWLGRVSASKGTKFAIEAAKKAGVKLKLMGAIDRKTPEMLKYYEEEVKPLIDGKQIEWLGEADMEMKVRVMRKARAFLNPLQWDEPFGLVMVESQAVGTPVISMRRGAAPEVIADGKTGFLVDSIDEMVEKIKQVDTLDRAACRKNVEDHFTVEKMTEGYLEAYKTVIDHWQEYMKKQNQWLGEQVAETRVIQPKIRVKGKA